MVYELPNNALGKGLIIGAYVLERLAHQQGGQRKPDWISRGLSIG